MPRCIVELYSTAATDTDKEESDAAWRLYRVAQKIGTIFLYDLTSSNINRFSKFFHCQNQEKICNNTITKDPATPQVCRYTTLCPIKTRRGVLPSRPIPAF